MNWISMKLLKVISWYFLRYEWEMPSLNLLDKVQFFYPPEAPFTNMDELDPSMVK